MTGSSPTLVPELAVTDFNRSLHFYTHILGFSIKYQRKQDGFAYLIRDMTELMIDQIGIGRTWEPAPLDYPLGRGINFQIEVTTIDPILNNLKKIEHPLFMDVEEKWYRKDASEVGNRQFLVQDPDGYLLRFTEDLGERPLSK